MNFHIITIFPEAFDSFIKTSIIGNSLEKKLFNIELYKLNDFSSKKFKHVDDKAYGMHGQVISPEPLSKAINFVKEKIKTGGTQGSPLPNYVGAGGIHRFTPTFSVEADLCVCLDIPIIYMSPSGDLLNQEKVENFYGDFKSKDIIIICGHYEGIDQRIIEKYVDYEISIGEYILTSGELSAMILIDSLVRHIPKVLGNPKSLEEESFSKFFDRQKEHPVYTRPKVFENMEVPEILTSGNHQKIENWKINNLKK